MASLKKLTIPFLLSLSLFLLNSTNTYAKESIITFPKNAVPKIEQILEDTPYQLYENVQVITADLSNTQIQQLHKMKSVVVEKDEHLITEGKESQVFSLPNILWNFQSIKLDHARKLNLTGATSKIAVIDTGINENHYLKVRNHVVFSKDDPQTAINEGDQKDRGHSGKGHGTAVASIIATKPFLTLSKGGVAPNAVIDSLKYADGTKKGKSGDIVKAVDWAIEQKVDLINLSSGLQKDLTSIHQSMIKAREAGIIVVASAGNDGQDHPLRYPASYKEVISVGSINQYADISSFSNSRDAVDFLAPGEAINAFTSNGSVQKMYGTSFAAPHITGMFALLAERYPYMPDAQLIEKLKSLRNAHLVPELNLKPVKMIDPPTSFVYQSITDHEMTLQVDLPKKTEAIVSINGVEATRSSKSIIKLKKLKSNTPYSVGVRFTDMDGQWSDEVVKGANTLLDKSPPDVPYDTTSIVLKSNQVSLKWKLKKPQDFSHFLIYENKKRIGQTKNNHFTTVKAIAKKKHFTYTIVAVDEDGNRSKKAYSKVIRYR